MQLNNSILRDIREAVGLESTNPEFDVELIMHINTAIVKLNQNGIGKFLIVQDDTSVWNDLQDPLQLSGNLYFQMIPLYVTLSTKLVFDPPPPSSVEYQNKSRDELLWRLKIAYEDYTTSTT